MIKARQTTAKALRNCNTFALGQMYQLFLFVDVTSLFTNLEQQIARLAKKYCKLDERQATGNLRVLTKVKAMYLTFKKRH